MECWTGHHEQVYRALSVLGDTNSKQPNQHLSLCPALGRSQAHLQVGDAEREQLQRH